MLWMCSGHGVCLTNPATRSCPAQAALAWLDRYVKDDTNAKVGRRSSTSTRTAREFTADEYPLPASTPIIADRQRARSR